MLDGKASISKEGRPHVNYDAMQHRELLTPGPAAAKLRIRPSAYQKLACGSSKRQAESATVDSSASSIHGGVQPSAKLDNIQPIKAVKVIHHRFSDAESVNERSGTSPEPEIGDEHRIISKDSKVAQEKEVLRATPDCFMHGETLSGKRESPKGQLRKYNFGACEGEPSSERVLRPHTKPVGRLVSQMLEAKSEEAQSGSSRAQDKDAADKGALSGHLCSGLACEYSGCDLRAELRELTSDLPSSHNQISNNGFNMSGGSSSLLYDHLASNNAPNNNLHQSANPPPPGDLDASLVQSHQHPLMSMREMATTFYPKVDNHVQNPYHQHDPAARTSGEAISYMQQDKCISETAFPATVSVSPPISPIAKGRVWESRATRRERRRQELVLAKNNPPTPAFFTPNPSTASDFATNYSVHLDGTSSVPPNLPTSFTPTLNTLQVSSASRAPPRFQNQDTNCLVCLQPVTPSDLLVADLRCVACPRVFHGPCVTYITPSMNQNWRCSLCYKEGWHGYGHVPAERDVNNPSLVERYRRRLLLAKTYGDPSAGPDSVRFWLEVDMDGGFESDQMVFVRMGMANEFMLRLVGQGKVRTVEEMERWGIALGMRLQEEEAKVENLLMELERLKGVVGEKEREIEELESGL